MRATLKGFTARTRTAISTIYVCGGTANLLGIEEQLTRDLGIPCKLLSLPPEASAIDTPQQHAAAQVVVLQRLARFGQAEFRQVGGLILRVIDALSANPEGDAAVEAEVRAQVRALCEAFPIYGAD